jgi:hypothetical protein
MKAINRYHNSKSPSVRDVSAAAGLRSSRSGPVLITKMIKRWFVYRDHAKKLRMAEQVTGCDVELTKLAASGKFSSLSQNWN